MSTLARLLPQWSVNCEACKRPGPSNRTPFTSMLLAQQHGWRYVGREAVSAFVCRECAKDPEATLDRVLLNRANVKALFPRVLQSTLP
jgi:hypothetical protein